MEKKMSIFKRIMSVLLVLTMIGAYVPLGAMAEEVTVPKGSYLETSIIDNEVIDVNEPFGFTYRTCPDADDANTMVKGSFAISKDGTPVEMRDVATLKYMDAEGNWYEFYTDFGPPTGFPLKDLTSKFEITFKEAGIYTVTVTIFKVDSEGNHVEALCKDEKVLKVGIGYTIKSTLSENQLIVQKPVYFSVTTEANSDSGKKVIGSFVIMEGNNVVGLDKVAKLEYYEVQIKDWCTLTGDFGPSTGFPLQNTSSQFRITFIKEGTYKVLTTLKDVDPDKDLINTGVVEETIVVDFLDSVVATDMADKTYETGRPTSFTLKIAANSSAETYAKGRIVVYKDDAQVVLDDTLILEGENWNSATGEFGPEDGFKLTGDMVSNFKVTFKKAGKYSVKIYINNMEGTELCSAKADLTVTDPSAVYSLKGGESIEDKWYGPDQTVVIRVENVLTEDALAGVLINGSYVAGKWTNDGSNNWTREILLKETSTVQYGDQDPVTVKIDSVTPTAEIPSAEVRDGKTTGKYSVTVGASDLKTVTIGGKEISINEAEKKENGDGTFTYTGTFVLSEEVKSVSIVAVNNAGDSSEPNEMEPQAGLTVKFTGAAENLGTVEGVTYLKKENGEKVTITVSGTEETGIYAKKSATITAKDQDGNIISADFSWNGAAWQAEVPLSNGLSELTVEFADNSDRSITKEFETKYGIDKEAPKVEVTREINPVNTVGTTEYYNTSVTYTFTISDILLGEDNPSNVRYTIDGVKTETIYFKDCKDAKVEIPVGNGEKLTNITVTAVDKTGNKTEYDDLSFSNENLEGTWTSGVSYDYAVIVDEEAPKIELSLSDNVTSLYMNSEGEYFAKVEPVEYSEENKGATSTTVTIFANITDENLDEAAVAAFMKAAGWEMNADGKWEKSITVDPDKTAAFDFAFMAKDLAQNFSKDDVILETPNASGSTEAPVLTISSVAYHDNDGAFYTATLLVDRRAPSSSDPAEAPKITLSTDTTYVTKGDNLQLFSGNVTYQMSITDLSEEKYDAGVKNVSWSVSAEDAPGFLSVNESGYEINEKGYVTEDGKYEIVVTANGNQETDNAKLTIVVEDYVGNKYTYYKTFAVDNLAPRVTITQDNQNVRSDYYFNNDQAITVKIEDLNFEPTTSSVKTEVPSNGWQNVGENTYQTVLTYDKEGNYTFEMAAADLANNEAVIDYTTNLFALQSFTIDKTPPVVEVTMDLNGGTLVNTLNGVDYYNANVTYNIKVSDLAINKVSDLDINKDTDAVAYVKFILEDGNKELCELLTLEDNDASEGEEYEAKFTVEDGKVLTDIEIVVIDNAGNIPNEITGFEYDSENKTWNYAGNDVAVDTTAPEITITKTVKDGKFVKDYKGVDYYNAAVTYEFKVEDAFLNPGAGCAELVITYLDGSEATIDLTADVQAAAEANHANTDKYSRSFTVEDGMAITDITLNVKDNAGNTVAYDQEGSITNLTVEDADALTAFAYDETAGIWNYTGNTVVADATAPEIGLRFRENVKSVFFNTKNNTIYAILTNPVVGGSGQSVTADDEKVTVTIKVTDKNLAIDNDFVNALKANPEHGFKWSGNTPVNEDTTVTFTATSTDVGADGVAKFVIDVNVIDLAGWIPDDFDSNKTVDDSTFMKISVDDRTGHINYNVSVDRQRPSSSYEDVKAPTIEIVPSITPTKTADGKDLFNEAFHFDLHVTDGEDSVLNSDIKYVNWIIEDSNGVVASDVKNKSGDDLAEDGNYRIDIVLPNGAGESNDVTLTIDAEDNVGNHISFKKVFGVDNLAPRVNVDFDNNSAQNEKYFKADRTATITITDINYNGVTVNTEGHYVVNDNIVTCIYNTDGDYTLSLSTTDLANNTSSDEKNNIDYINAESKTNVAPTDFTIDKTAPVIHVNYNPAFYVDVDPAGVQYFDEDRTVTVTIEEHNFRDEDVVSDLGAKNSLAGWTKNGDNYTAYSTFTEGNGYSVKVNYTDLAGNPAQGYSSPTFSVDKTAPTIELTKGEMTTSQMNIVSGDLLLGFTVNDAQNNLKDFGDASVEVYFTGSNFKQEKLLPEDCFIITGAGDRTTGYIDFANIATGKQTDGIYTVRITVRDYAGHVTTLGSDLVFSLNRCGSTFLIDDDFTKSFLNFDNEDVIYHQNVADKMVIKEINPNKVYQDSGKTKPGSLITISVNGNSFSLTEGVDYTLNTVNQGTGNNKWYEYIYSIDPSVFTKNEEQVDGEYSILFYSEDEASNKNTSKTIRNSAILEPEDKEYSGKVEFTLDHKAPVITILGIENNEDYNEEFVIVDINIADNTPVSVRILVNGKEVKCVENSEGQATDSDWFYFDKNSGNYKLNLSQKTGLQDVEVIATDAAGNETPETVNDININSNVLLLFIYNVPAVLATVVGLSSVTALLVVLMKKRKKIAA